MEDKNFIEFLNRINSFERKELKLDDSSFVAHPELSEKVNPDKTFRPFYGDTVVFDLDDKIKSLATNFADILQDELPECFCERLNKSEFHMTLHDLSSSKYYDEIANKTAENKEKVRAIFNSYKPTFNTINMTTTFIFNMVGKSIVLGLRPTDSTEFDNLMELYRQINKVKTLNYRLTPHITLAYYNTNGFSADVVKRLKSTVYKLNNTRYEFQLSLKDLKYKTFTDMNHYESIFSFK